MSAEPAAAVPRRAAGGVLVVGGGFGGVSVARLLGRRGATIVSAQNSMLFTPLLPEVAARRHRDAQRDDAAGHGVPPRRGDRGPSHRPRRRWPPGRGADRRRPGDHHRVRPRRAGHRSGSPAVPDPRADRPCGGLHHGPRRPVPAQSAAAAADSGGGRTGSRAPQPGSHLRVRGRRLRRGRGPVGAARSGPGRVALLPDLARGTPAVGAGRCCPADPGRDPLPPGPVRHGPAGRPGGGTAAEHPARPGRRRPGDAQRRHRVGRRACWSGRPG